MPKTDQHPILVNDIFICVLKVILAGGRDVVGPAQAILRVADRAKGFFNLEVWWRAAGGEHIQFGYLADGDPVSQVCYQLIHVPTSYVSPIYSHEFDEVTHNWGLPMKIGTMALYPAERVWPELTKRGWYGELPQFFN